MDDAARMGTSGCARGVLRPLQQRGGPLQRQAVRRLGRRTLEGARCKDRKGSLEGQDRRMEGRLFDHLGAHGRERRADDGDDRRRVRRPGFRGRLRSRYRQALVAPSHDRGPRRKGNETWPAGDAYLRGGGSTWITGSYDPELDLTYW